MFPDSDRTPSQRPVAGLSSSVAEHDREQPDELQVLIAAAVWADRAKQI
jgi:hypothetical protein